MGSENDKKCIVTNGCASNSVSEDDEMDGTSAEEMFKDKDGITYK